MKFSALPSRHDGIRNNLYVYNKEGLKQNKIHNERDSQNWSGIFQRDLELGKHQPGVQPFNATVSAYTKICGSKTQNHFLLHDPMFYYFDF